MPTAGDGEWLPSLLHTMELAGDDTIDIPCSLPEYGSNTGLEGSRESNVFCSKCRDVRRFLKLHGATTQRRKDAAVCQRQLIDPKKLFGPRVLRDARYVSCPCSPPRTARTDTAKQPSESGVQDSRQQDASGQGDFRHQVAAMQKTFLDRRVLF